LLVDCLVYIVLFFVVTGVSFSFFYTAWDGSFALRRNADDIASVLKAGELWRADVRNATGALQVEPSTNNEVLRIPQKTGEIVYKFSDGSLSRSADGRDWKQVLSQIKTSRMESERRQQVTAWRWEIELAPIKKRTSQLHPLFMFEAVPHPAANP
jgi:hypothetical protein